MENNKLEELIKLTHSEQYKTTAGNKYASKVIAEFNFGETIIYIPAKKPVPVHGKYDKLDAKSVFPPNVDDGYFLRGEGSILYSVGFTSLVKMKKVVDTSFYFALPSNTVRKLLVESKIYYIILNHGSNDFFWIKAEGNLPNKKDLEASELEFIRKADAGDSVHQFKLACNYLNGLYGLDRINDAMKYFLLSAKQGNLDAQHALATRYRRRDVIVADNDAEAFKWYMSAALGGRPDSQCSVGTCYASGEGIKRDPVEANKWFLKSAEQGYAIAQGNLAVHLENGIGCEPNPIEAIKWYRKAAQGGYEIAQYNLACALLREANKGKENPEIIQLLTEAAKKGMVDAMNLLFKLYWTGSFTKVNKELAIGHITHASNSGDTSAMVILGKILIDEDEGMLNVKEGKEWLIRAALSGDSEAPLWASVACQLGDGKKHTQEDVIDGMAWLHIAVGNDVTQKYAIQTLEQLKVEYPEYIKESENRARELEAQIVR
jgi:TPR repeat protein